MVWKIEFDTRVEKDLVKLDRSLQKKILKYLKDRVISIEDPRLLGKPLRANHQGLWRYRVENSRIICKLEDDKKIIFVLAIGHRKNVYSILEDKNLEEKTG